MGGRRTAKLSHYSTDNGAKPAAKTPHALDQGAATESVPRAWRRPCCSELVLRAMLVLILGRDEEFWAFFGVSKRNLDTRVVLCILTMLVMTKARQFIQDELQLILYYASFPTL